MIVETERETTLHEPQMQNCVQASITPLRQIASRGIRMFQAKSAEKCKKQQQKTE